jgi:hypothetical protein
MGKQKKCKIEDARHTTHGSGEEGVKEKRRAQSAGLRGRGREGEAQISERRAQGKNDDEIKRYFLFIVPLRLYVFGTLSFTRF